MVFGSLTITLRLTQKYWMMILTFVSEMRIVESSLTLVCKNKLRLIQQMV